MKRIKRKEFYAAARRSLYWARVFRATGDEKFAAMALQSFRRDRDFARSFA